MLTKRPNPFDEILAWAKANRPDTLMDLDVLFKEIQSPTPTKNSTAMGFMISIAFAAGREYGERYGDEQAREHIRRMLDPSGTLRFLSLWEDIEAIVAKLHDIERRRAARWKALARRLFRERVPILRVCHEVGNALVPAKMGLDRIMNGRGSPDTIKRVARCVERVLDFTRNLRAGDASARVWRRS